MLNDVDSLNLQTRNALKDWGIRDITIVGGESVISQDVMIELINLGYRVDRVSGLTRYHTNISIAERYFEQPTAFVGASGEDFPDALVSAVYAAIHHQPIVLLHPEQLSTTTINYIQSQDFEEGLLMGGPLAISPEVEETIRLLIQ